MNLSKINKIVVIEGLDKTGKTTFVDIFDNTYTKKCGLNSELIKFSFPNKSTPIGSVIRNELSNPHPNSEVVSTPNFLSEMSHFWMLETFKHNFKTIGGDSKNYLFDRYFISTLAYQAFYNDSLADLEFISVAIKDNKFLKLPTDLIMFDLPTTIIIDRTHRDALVNKTDSNDTTDVEVINRRRTAYKKAVDFLNGFGITIHWIDNVSAHDANELADNLVEKIFK